LGADVSSCAAKDDHGCSNDRCSTSRPSLRSAQKGSRAKRLDARAAAQHENHAVADAKGRLLSILLTGGEAILPTSSAPNSPDKSGAVAPCRQSYDSAELRQCWKDAAPTSRSQQVQPQQPSVSTEILQQRHRIENALPIEDFHASRRATTACRNFLALRLSRRVIVCDLMILPSQAGPRDPGMTGSREYGQHERSSLICRRLQSRGRSSALVGTVGSSAACYLPPPLSIMSIARRLPCCSHLASEYGGAARIMPTLYAGYDGLCDRLRCVRHLIDRIGAKLGYSIAVLI